MSDRLRNSVYVWGISAAGLVAVASSLVKVSQNPNWHYWLILAALTLLASAATLKMSDVAASFSVADVFSFAAVLLFGPAAGTLNVALDCLMISSRLAKRDIAPRRAAFNATAPALAMYIAATVVSAIFDLRALAAGPGSTGEMFLALAVLALFFFVMDTGLIASAVALEDKQSVLAIWKGHFATLWLSFCGSAYAAGVLVTFVQRHDLTLLAIVTPLPFILYFALKHWLNRLHAEQTLRERDAQLVAVFENALDPFVVVDNERRLVDVNPATCQLLGVSAQALHNVRLDDVLAPDDIAALPAQWEAFLREGRASGERRVKRPDGGHLIVEFNAKANVVPGRHLSVWRDVTDRRRLEEQVRHSQKMETVGRLAGGIAHDFNNLLTVILGYNALVLERATGATRDDVLQVHLAAERARALTGQLLAFSRRQMLQPAIVDLNLLVTNAEKMFSRLIGENIVIRTQLDENLLAIEADPTQLEQVLVNLAVNARDAMPDGGQLTIATANVQAGRAAGSTNVDIPAGKYVLLSVTDTGTGMDEATKAHVFEPFFTTKERGKGTGLGLATAYGIIEQSGGHVRLDSAPGAGTTFRIYLPAMAAAKHEASNKAAGTTDTGPIGSETILLVEDEDGVRTLMTRALEARGYRLLVARDGAEAMTVAAAHAHGIDLLLTDIAMPGINGRELARSLRLDAPDLPVLFVSGYAGGATAGEAGTTFIQKPFTFSGLANAVRELLDASKAIQVRRLEEKASSRRQVRART